MFVSVVQSAQFDIGTLRATRCGRQHAKSGAVAAARAERWIRGHGPATDNSNVRLYQPHSFSPSSFSGYSPSLLLLCHACRFPSPRPFDTLYSSLYKQLVASLEQSLDYCAEPAFDRDDITAPQSLRLQTPAALERHHNCFASHDGIDTSCADQG